MSSLIECNSLTKGFGAKTALDNISFTVSPGPAIGLVGPNGAGKTTLLSILSGFLKPSSGQVKIHGALPDNSSLKGKIGILPQDIPFMQGISVWSQLLLFANLQGLKKEKAEEEILRVLKLLDITNLAKQYPETLSYGQRKRVTIAQAIIGQPGLILLDEPTSGLDPVAANEVRNLVRNLGNQSTFIISSHNLDEIEDVCKEIILIDKGRIIRHCSISELVELNNCLSITCEQSFTDLAKEKLLAHPEINQIICNPGNVHKVAIYFNSDSPESLQIKILELLQQHQIKVLEFSRGSALTEKVVDLVKDIKH